MVMFSLECLAELFQIEQIPEGFLLALTRSNAFVTSRIGSGGPAGRGGSLNSFSRSKFWPCNETNAFLVPVIKKINGRTSNVGKI